MTTVRERYLQIFGSGRTTERVMFFSDAVFAIALTLLVIDLRVPDEDHGETSLDVMVSLIPGFIAFVISFAVIAANWTGHHRKFHVITSYDSRLIRLNFLLLFLIAFTPFPTSLMAEYPGEVPSVVLYATVVGLLNFAQLAVWVYAWRHKMIDDRVEASVYRYVCRELLIVPVMFGLSILVAVFWDPIAAMWSWILIAPVSIIVGTISGRRLASAVSSQGGDAGGSGDEDRTEGEAGDEGPAEEADGEGAGAGTHQGADVDARADGE